MSSAATPTEEAATTPVNLLQTLINVTEKASNIARICRSNEQLLGLLVQEKCGDEANARFEHDFKTLADVLIQETIKHDVGQSFSSLCAHIKGEESPNFTNALGESVTIKVGVDVQETLDCLSTVLDGHVDAAAVLAEEVHRRVEYTSQTLGSIPQLPFDLDYDNIGIWIDPIDATAEYISGDSIFTNFPGITSTGLDCVTVLVGAYELSSGVPIIGIISQPFHKKIDEHVYESHIFWGISVPQLQANNCDALAAPTRNPLAIFSSSENAEILQQVIDLGYEIAFSAGAGHKALKVISGEVDLYLLSKGSTFRWDTCAPQAILRSLGGNIYDYRESVKQKCALPISYLSAAPTADTVEEDTKCNKGGLIAVRDDALLEPLLQKLAAAQ